MKTRLKKATPFVVSLTLHLAALLLVSFNLSSNGGNSNEQGGPIEVEMVEGAQQQNNNKDEEIVPKQVEVQEVEKPPVVQEESPVEVPEEQKPEEGLTECENDMWFGGIGIEQDWRTGRVDRVFPGYPANKAGLREGDMIQMVDGNSDTMGGKIRGTPGTTITLMIFRPSTNEYLTLIFKRDKICIGKRL